MVKYALKTVFCSFFRKYSFFRKNCLIWKYLVSNLWQKRLYSFWCKMTQSPKKWLCPHQIFFRHFFGKCCFYWKSCWMKQIFKTLVPIKNYIQFWRKITYVLKMVMLPKIFFSEFSWKIPLSSKKRLDEKIFKISFPIKKVIFIFIARCPFPSKGTWPPKIVFHFFLGKYNFYWKNLVR